MLYRQSKPLLSNSFFLFGARGTGKSTLVRSLLKEKTLFFDLLDDETYDQLMRNPKILEEAAQSKHYSWIALDEIQRLPKLLNSVHRLIESTGQKFALTGSSSRKLKRGAANLLAGRAFVNVLFPLTNQELKNNFNLDEILHWGSLPKITHLNSNEEKKAYLRSYCLTYIKEEIQAEQIVRKLEPFREFLPVVAQMSGKPINFSSIARAVGVQIPTVQSYYQILEDTYLGFTLPAFHRSIRKSQLETPKFFLFDNGVKKALEGSLDSAPSPATSTYGELFEAWVIQEIFRANQYHSKDYRLSHYRTKAGSEIDLVLSKGKQIILVEIKSSNRIDEKEVNHLDRMKESFGSSAKTYYLSRDRMERKIGSVHCIPWEKFLEEFAKL